MQKDLFDIKKEFLQDVTCGLEREKLATCRESVFDSTTIGIDDRSISQDGR